LDLCEEERAPDRQEQSRNEREPEKRKGRRGKEVGTAGFEPA
jgi:hypothetical protein